MSAFTALGNLIKKFFFGEDDDDGAEDEDKKETPKGKPLPYVSSSAGKRTDPARVR